ncbi:uncharacterized protein [Coffea arabica]|uniref:DNA/RNA polymerases superfamily protein n=1 Tax=Coffea arabica TaxID=13443 RepID=A0A6P6XKP7_COFAR|nr:uncharacterized protein LOC113743886 [Coffea arabica]
MDSQKGQIQTLDDMLRSCILDFGESWSKYLTLVEFAYNNSFHSSIQMAPYEALYGRKCRSPICWDEIDERKILDPTTVPWIEEAREKVKLIRQRIQTAQNRQKSYADNRRKDLEFAVGDQVFLKITPLKKYHPDPSYVLQPENIEIDETLTYDDKPVKLLDRKVKELRNKRIPLVKVLWRNHGVEEATWEVEEQIRKKYPDLFPDQVLEVSPISSSSSSGWTTSAFVAIFIIGSARVFSSSSKLSVSPDSSISDSIFVD